MRGKGIRREGAGWDVGDGGVKGRWVWQSGAGDLPRSLHQADLPSFYDLVSTVALGVVWLAGEKHHSECASTADDAPSFRGEIEVGIASTCSRSGSFSSSRCSAS